MNNKQKCSALFSETIRQTMKEMGGRKHDHKSLPSAQNAPLKTTLIVENFWKDHNKRSVWMIHIGSYGHQKVSGCTAPNRIFFNKKAPTSTNKWKTQLKHTLQEKIGVSPRFGKDIRGSSSSSSNNNYMEIVITDPKLILALLNKRVAGFLD